MDFFTAFSETSKDSASGNGSPAAASAAASAASVPDFTSDDMKAYVDAKLEALKSDLLTEMQSLNKTVETPEETGNNSQENNNNSQNEGGNENVSSSNLSSSEHDSK